jgi:hypothetical protein
MGVTAGIFLASILLKGLKEMHYLVYILRYLWSKAGKNSILRNSRYAD